MKRTIEASREIGGRGEPKQSNAVNKAVSRVELGLPQARGRRFPSATGADKAGGCPRRAGMNFVAPKRGKNEKSRGKLEQQLRRLKDIFFASALDDGIVETVWVSSAKDFQLSLKRLLELTGSHTYVDIAAETSRSAQFTGKPSTQQLRRKTLRNAKKEKATKAADSSSGDFGRANDAVRTTQQWSSVTYASVTKEQGQAAERSRRTEGRNTRRKHEPVRATEEVVKSDGLDFDDFEVVARRRRGIAKHPPVARRVDEAMATKLMVSKLQKASKEYKKGNNDYAFVLAEDAKAFQSTAVHIREDEAEKIFSENNSDFSASIASNGLDSFETRRANGGMLPPTQVDLHGLRVHEALGRVSETYATCLKSVKDASEQRGGKRTKQLLHIITGHARYRGIGGQSRLMVSIKHLLAKKGIAFDEHVGSLVVTVKN